MKPQWTKHIQSPCPERSTKRKECEVEKKRVGSEKKTSCTAEDGGVQSKSVVDCETRSSIGQGSAAVETSVPMRKPCQPTQDKIPSRYTHYHNPQRDSFMLRMRLSMAVLLPGLVLWGQIYQRLRRSRQAAELEKRQLEVLETPEVVETTHEVEEQRVVWETVYETGDAPESPNNS